MDKVTLDGICFHYDSLNFHRDQWAALFDVFSVDSIYELGTPEDNFDTLWKHRTSVEQVLSESDKQITPVLFTPRNAKYIPGDIPLMDFKHPTNAVYFFGSDNQHQPLIDIQTRVYLPILKANHLWSFQMAAIVLYDRLLKNGNNG